MRNDDRVLEGLRVDDGAESLASLMDALRVPGLDHELSDQAQSVAAFTAALGAADTVDRPRRGRPVTSRRSRFALSLALSGAALVATSGLAYAGALPGAAQDTARGVLAGLGVTVPGPNQHAGTHPDTRGNSAAAPAHAATAGTGTDATGDTSSGKGKGAAISNLARTTTATGRDKGAIISTAASGGKSHAGNPPGGANTHHSAGTSDQGGTGTADGASGGRDGQGSSTAQTASDGHSSAGSGNAGSHPAAH
jgi:hypothetical protein